jgi:Asp-tRNA(Asn)/Glu-tRNA(Gln) amidotransferase A subunit family amidase
LQEISPLPTKLTEDPDMPTQFNSSIYTNDAPQVDAGSIGILRKAGALIFGKTTTTEFAAITVGPKTKNPHDPNRTPGGSSSGSGAAVGDFQAPIGLGTQTGGSTIRPGSYNGIYALKPTWNSITREGQKIYSLILDTLGLYARSVADLELLADTFAIHDDSPAPTDFKVQGAKFAVLKTMVWPHIGPGGEAAMSKAVSLLREQGAEVEEIELPARLFDLPKWHATVLNSDGRTAFLPEYAMAKEQLNSQLVGHVENSDKISRKAQLDAFDNISAARPVVDEILGKYAAVLTPSVPDEAPLGTVSTGSATFCLIWTVSFALWLSGSSSLTRSHRRCTHRWSTFRASRAKMACQLAFHLSRLATTTDVCWLSAKRLAKSSKPKAAGNETFLLAPRELTRSWSNVDIFVCTI